MPRSIPMIQFFRFVGSSIEDSHFNIITGKNNSLFFLKHSLYLILFVYSTLFLVVAIPFVKTPFIPIYFIGGFATSVFILRFVNHIVKYVRYKNGSISVNKDGLVLKEKDRVITIPAPDINYIERNFLGNLLIRQKLGKSSFPLMLLGEEDREKLISLFQDMA